MIKKINVKGQDYKVKMVDKVDDYDSMGNCDRENKIIKINKNLNSIQRQITFFHEFFHALFGELSVCDRLTDDLEEIIVDQCAIEIIKLINMLKNRGKNAGL